MDRNKEIEIWPVVKLGEHCHKPEYGLTTSASSIPSTPKFLRITDIQDEGVNWDDVPYCESTEDLRESQKLLPGDVVIARIGATTGKAYVIRQCPDAVFASYLIRVRTKPELLPEFLGFYLQTEDYWKQIDQNKGGRLKGGVNIPILQNLTLPLPTLSKQRAITRALRAVQEAREARRKELHLERERKATLMQHLFTHGTRGEARKQTEIGEMPESWRVVELNQVVNIVYGVQAAVAHLLDESVGIPILTNINISNEGTLDLTKLRYYELPESKRDALVLRKGDILFNWRSGSQDHVGKTALFEEDGAYTFSSFILRFRTNEGTHNEYLRYYLHKIKSEGFFVKRRQQSSINSVFNASVAATIPIALPGLDEQHEISNALRACDLKLFAIEKESALLDELFRAMLEELMTGRLSTVPLIED